MDYFKHYSTASDSKSMNLIFDEFGHRGMMFYWMLSELCAENWDGVGEPEFNFHQRTVVTKFKSSLGPVLAWLRFCSEQGLCAFAQNGTQFEIKFPKLKEIKETRGRIKGNQLEKSDIYRIDKEEDKDLDKEENKSFPTPQKLLSELASTPPYQLKPRSTGKSEWPEINPDGLIQLFNDKLAKKAGKIQYCRGLSADQIKTFFTTISYPEFSTAKVWEEIFEKVSKSPFLCGSQKGSNFVATLDWLVIHGNALKVINGKYQEASGDDKQEGTTQDYINSVELN